MQKNNIQNIFKILFWTFIIFITIMAFIPQSIKLTPKFSDKINHIGAFFVLAMLGSFAFRTRIVTLAFYLMGFGFLIEAVQYFLPYRRFSLYDMMADLIGILIFVLIQYSARRYRAHSPNTK